MQLTDLGIRPMTVADRPHVCAIYEAGITTANATFETAAPTYEAWDRSHLADHRLEAAGIWTLQTGIFPENVASLALHQRCGFRIIGTRERIGKLHGVWRDTLLLERRSATVGL